MKFHAFLLTVIVGLLLPQPGYSLLALPVFLEQVVKESVYIVHVKVKKTEQPFGDENSIIRLGLCDVIEVIKEDLKDPNNFVFPTSFEDEEIKQIIVSMFIRRDMCPVSEGGEYIFFCRSVALSPSVVGSSRIYPIVDKKVSAYLADFPKPGTSVEEIKKYRESSQTPKTQIDVSDFIKQVRGISEAK